MANGLLRKLRGTYAEAARTGTLKPLPIRCVPGGAFVAAEVCPWDTDDALQRLFGIRGELWIADGAAKYAARSLPVPPVGGRTALVMAAGNNEAIPVVDVRPVRPATTPPQPATPPSIRHWHALHPAAARAADPARPHLPQALDRLFCHGEARLPPPPPK
jgi:hypothetical protein